MLVFGKVEVQIEMQHVDS